MYKIQTLNKMAATSASCFDGAAYAVSDAETTPDAILVRSEKLHDKQFNSELLCIARAGAGTNNIPSARCAEEGIVVFNTPGANAEAVKELALAGMLLASRDILGGIEWVNSIAGTPDVAAQVEKGKSAFVGPELQGKILGVIGLGAIGIKLANDAQALGMGVMGYDPYMSVSAAHRLSPAVCVTTDIAQIYKTCDYISIHVPYIADGANATHHYVNSGTIAQMKRGVVILNLARAELVSDDDIIAALADGQVSKYVTDFPNEKTAGAKGIIAIPHLGASTPESEERCAFMAAEQTINYIENGNIVNSVNLPALTAPRAAGTARVCVIFKSAPDAIALLTAAVSANAELAATASATRGDYGYAIFDVKSAPSELKAAVEAVGGAIRVRVLEA